MIFEIEEAKRHCDWLMEKGLGLGECATFLGNMDCGDTFSIALLKVFINRQDKLEKIHGKITSSDWGSPITP